MMLRFKLRTKVELFSAILLLIILGAISVASLNRTITDSGDTSYTYIRNSNGKYWEATGANLQIAINDLGNTGGTIWVGDDITLTAPITVKNYTILNFESHRVTITADVSFINMTGGNLGNVIRDAIVRVPNGYTSSVIKLYLPNAAGNGWLKRIYNNLFENIQIENPYFSTNYGWTGIHLQLNSPANGDGASMLSNTFRKISINGAKYGIHIQTISASDAWANSNYFDDILIYGYERGVYIDGIVGGGALAGNTFNNVVLQTVARTTYGFYIDGGSNSFVNCFVWDWYAASSPVKEWYICPTATKTYIQTATIDSFQSGVYDLGINTQVISNDMGHLYDRSPYTYIIFRNTTTVFLMNGSTGLITDKSTNAQYIFYRAQYRAANSVIFIREGTYDIGSYISSTYGAITWLGSDKHKTIMRANTTLTSGIFNANSRHNVTYRNICFEGAGQEAEGIQIAFDTSTHGIVIDNCIFNNFTGGTTSAAIYSSALSSDTISNIKITNCEFNNNDYAIWMRGDTDSKVVSSDISDNYFYGSNGYNILLDFSRNCTVSNNRIVGGTWGIIFDDCKDCIASNNIISSTNGIDEQGGSDFNIIMGNNCRACTTPIDINGSNTINGTNLGTIS